MTQWTEPWASGPPSPDYITIQCPTCKGCGVVEVIEGHIEDGTDEYIIYEVQCATCGGSGEVVDDSEIDPDKWDDED